MRTRGENEVRAFFESAGLDKEIHRFEESTHNSELAARSLGVQVGQIAKTILLLSGETAMAVVISGDRRVDTKKVRALGYGKRVRLAGPEDVVSRTGFAVGAVSPVALPDGVPIYLDRSLRRFETIYPAAGETNNMFATTPDELLSLTGGTETDLARDEGGRPATPPHRVAPGLFSPEPKENTAWGGRTPRRPTPRGARLRPPCSPMCRVVPLLALPEPLPGLLFPRTLQPHLREHSREVCHKSQVLLQCLLRDDRNLHYRVDIFFFVEPVGPSLRPEVIKIRLFEEQLTRENGPDVFALDDDRGRSIDQSVGTFIGNRRVGLADVIGDVEVALDAPLPGLGVGAVEFRADVLPARAGVDFPVVVDDGGGDFGRGVEAVQGSLKPWNIQEIRDLM